MNARNFLIVVNPASGKKPKHGLVRLAQDMMHAQGISSTVLETKASMAENEHMLAEMLQKGHYSDVMGVGGDGTLHQLANVLANRPEALSVLAAGTGNDFAKNLEQHASAADQVRMALQSPAVAIDLGKCDGRYFLNTMGLGFDGEVVAELAKNGKSFNGHLAYLSTVLKMLAFYKERTVRISISGEPSIEMPIFMLAVNNGKVFGGGFQIAPKAEIADGLLDCCAIGKLSIFERFLHLPKVERGKHLTLSMVRYRQTESVSIKSDAPILGHLDGELMRGTAFDIHIEKHALWVRGVREEAML